MRSSNNHLPRPGKTRKGGVMGLGVGERGERVEQWEIGSERGNRGVSVATSPWKPILTTPPGTARRVRPTKNNKPNECDPYFFEHTCLYRLY